MLIVNPEVAGASLKIELVNDGFVTVIFHSVGSRCLCGNDLCLMLHTPPVVAAVLNGETPACTDPLAKATVVPARA